MRYGWLVVNAYLKSIKFNEIYDYLIEAARRRDCKLEIVTNEAIMIGLGKLLDKKPQFAIFWDKDIKAAKLLEINSVKVFNSAKSIEICDDKSRTYLELADTDIKMPETIVSPLNYGIKTNNDIFLKNAIKRIGLPFIIKENCGSFGAQVYMANNEKEASDIIEGIEGGYIIQEYIKSSKGRDVRIHIVGDRYVTSMLRENEDDFRANVTNGGNMKKHYPTDEQIEMAIKVCRKLGLDFAGVDIMFGEKGEPVFCEVNSNAHFKNIMDCTGVNVADYILEYVMEKVY